MCFTSSTYKKLIFAALSLQMEIRKKKIMFNLSNIVHRH